MSGGNIVSVLSRRAVTAGLLAVPAIASPAIIRAAEPVHLRCSLDTGPTHTRNITIGDYLTKLETASSGRIKTQLFASGQLFSDGNLGKALIQGQVDMGAPGVWAITNVIPGGDLFQVPALYDRPLDIIHRITDGKAGAQISSEVETKLRSHVLGHWLDNGYNNWYSTRRALNSLDDLKGLKIRNSGGVGQSWRTRFFGALPNVTAWPDVPLALSQGTFDGLMTTDQSIVSAKLWDAGVHYALQDHNFFGAYIPVVSNAFWKALPPDLQTLMTETWAHNIEGYRAKMGAAQNESRGILEANGIKYVALTPEQASAARDRMMPEQEQVAKDMKISAELIALMQQDLSGAS
jgi:TRAP-type C4-dicarboxylate transport system substrate-binding protein